MLETERLTIQLATDDEIENMISTETVEELKIAYGEMLAGCKKEPCNRKWYAPWIIRLKLGEKIGDMCFKGLSENGMVEIGYGLYDGFHGKGYMTEAVREMVKWASEQSMVKRIEAETIEENFASKRVLEKAGFIPTGEIGEEGPRYVYIK